MTEPDEVSLRTFLEQRIDAQGAASSLSDAVSAEAVRIALEAQKTALSAALEAQKQALEAQKEAVRIALQVVESGATLHAMNHDRAHEAHERVHRLEKEWLVKSEGAMDTRLSAMNQFREQLKEQAASFVTRSEAETVALARQSRFEVAADAISKRVAETERAREELRLEMQAFPNRNEVGTQINAVNAKLDVADDARQKQAEELASMRSRSQTFQVIIVVALPVLSILVNVLFSFLQAKP